MPTPQLTVHNAEIKTATVEIKTLTAGGPMTLIDVRTILDALAEPTAVVEVPCFICDPTVPTGNGTVCDPCCAAIWARIDALLAAPEVVVILERLRALTETEQRKLETAWLANHTVHRITQINLHHWVSRAWPDRRDDLFTAGERVWKVGNEVARAHWPVGCAARDAAFAVWAADLLTADEARLFNSPWNDTIGAAR